jgi:tetratricopeptide (TPR) repeat protein
VLGIARLDLREGNFEPAIERYVYLASQEIPYQATVALEGGIALGRAGRAEQAEAWLARATNDTELAADAFNEIGLLRLKNGQVQPAIDSFRHGLVTLVGKPRSLIEADLRRNLGTSLLLRVTSDAKLAAGSFNEIGLLRHKNGQVQPAIDPFRRGLATVVRKPRSQTGADPRRNLDTSLERDRHLDDARQALDLSLTMYRSLADPIGMAQALAALAGVRRSQNELEGAARAANEAAEIFARARAKVHAGLAHLEAGDIYRDAGAKPDARRSFEAARNLFQESGAADLAKVVRQELRTLNATRRVIAWLLGIAGTSGATLANIRAWWRRTFMRPPQGVLLSFDDIFPQAELLLSYAATAGIQLDRAEIQILTAKIEEYKAEKKGSVYIGIHSDSDALVAYTRVVKQLLPVTASTLHEYSVGVQQRTRSSRWGTLFVMLIVSASLIVFVSSTISDSMKGEIDLANSKAIILLTHLGSPPGTGPVPGLGSNAPNPGLSTYSELDKLIDLQQFAISLRSIYGRAEQLRLLMFSGIADPFKGMSREEMRQKLELNPEVSDYDNFLKIVGTYQEVRAYAQSLRDGVAFWYGGIASSILPVFYALLGASAWSLRRMQIGLRDRTITNFGGNWSQWLLAAIAGTVISLFSGLFLSSAASLSPLAWAFLAGYSSDSVFQVLDGVLRTGVRNEPSSQTAPPQAGSA